MQGWLITSYNIKLYIYIYICMYVCMYGCGVVLCGFLIIKPYTAPHSVMQFTTICGVVRLLYFVGSFDWFECDYVV